LYNKSIIPDHKGLSMKAYQRTVCTYSYQSVFGTRFGIIAVFSKEFYTQKVEAD
jgi:hypothetical protein